MSDSDSESKPCTKDEKEELKIQDHQHAEKDVGLSFCQKRALVLSWTMRNTFRGHEV